MSGGHYGYKSSELSWLAQDIIQDVEKHQPGAGRDKYGDWIPELPIDVLTIMEVVAHDLIALSAIVHDIEWYMSGDYGDETLRESYNRWKELRANAAVPSLPAKSFAPDA